MAQPYNITDYGLNNALQKVFPSPIIANRAPTANDTGYPLGQVWINKLAGTSYILAQIGAGAAAWGIATGGGGGGVASITGNSGGALTGAITITGGTTGLTFSGAGTTETLGGTLAIANGGTNATSMATTFGVNYFDGTRLVTTAVGTAGQILTSNGVGVAPTFQNGAGTTITITGNSGGALTSGSFTFTGGTTGLLFSGAGTTETLTGTLVVSNGGTGIATATAFAPIIAGTTATGAFQTTASAGTAGQILVSGGAAALPVWTNAGTASSISITGNSGGALTGNAFTFTGGTTGLTFSGAGSTETLTGTLAIANGGTNATSMATTFGVNYFDGTRLVTTAVGTAGQVLTSNGVGVAPTFQAGGATISITGNTGGALTGTSFTFSGGTTGLSFGGAGSTETLTFAGITANGGTVNLATDATASAINIGTGAGVKTTILGSTNSTSPTTLQSGTGALNITSTNGVLTMISGTGNLNIGTDAAAGNINIGANNTVVKTLVIGSQNSTSSTQIVSGSGGLELRSTGGIIGFVGTVRFTTFAEGALITSSTGGVSTVTGTAGFVLTANAAGTAPSFQAVTATAAGSSTQIQFNNGGALAANANFVFITANNQLGIGLTTPDTSALVDLTSTTRGLLIPRMTTTQKNAIGTPATSLQVFDSTLNESQSYRTVTTTSAPCLSSFNAGATTPTTNVSAASYVPFVVGNYAEIIYASGNSTTNFTGTSALAINVAGVFSSVYSNNNADLEVLTYTSTVNLDKGVYSLEYWFQGDPGRGICDVAVNLAGAGAFITRNQFDTYTPTAGQFYTCRDYFTNTTAAASCVITWSTNGKNAASGGFFVIVSQVRVTRIG